MGFITSIVGAKRPVDKRGNPREGGASAAQGRVAAGSRPKKNPADLAISGVLCGGASRIRTADLWIMIPSL